MLVTFDKEYTLDEIDKNMIPLNPYISTTL